MNPLIPHRVLRDTLCKACATRTTQQVAVRSRFASPIGGFQRFTYIHSTPPSQSAIRSFSSSQPVHKKKKREAAEKEDDDDQSIPPEKVVEDAFDFSELDAGIAKNIEKLKDALSKLKPGGRLDTEVIENLRVSVGGKGGMQRLGDLATVVPKGGRTISVIAAEDQHLKPISAAIASSPHSLTPSPDPQNPLTVHIPLPPATTESREAVKKTAKDVHQNAEHGIRQARGNHHKKLRKIELDKKARVPKDEMARANKEMERRIETALKEAKKVYEERLKALDR